jgi:DNA-binding NarL/FixJ family response regulator
MIDDDESIIRMARGIFKKNPNFHIAECHSVSDALSQIEKIGPDVILVDHSLSRGGGEGLEIVKEIMSVKPDIEIHTTTNNMSAALQYRRLGIDHISKSDFEKIEDILNTDRVEVAQEKILFIDSYAGTIKAMRVAFDKNDNFMTAECHTVDEAIEAVLQSDPDTLFIRHRLTNNMNDGIEAIKGIRRIKPDIKIYCTDEECGEIPEYTEMGVTFIEPSDLKRMREIVAAKKATD